MISEKQDYLGDGVYCHHDGYHIVLTAQSNGQRNVIFLEPQVLEALKKYEYRLKNQG